MTLLTRCAACGTAFRVTEVQLAAHAGKVRCGTCRAVFDARAHLTGASSVLSPPGIATPSPGTPSTATPATSATTTSSLSIPQAATAALVLERAPALRKPDRSSDRAGANPPTPTRASTVTAGAGETGEARMAAVPAGDRTAATPAGTQAVHPDVGVNAPPAAIASAEVHEMAETPQATDADKAAGADLGADLGANPGTDLGAHLGAHQATEAQDAAQVMEADEILTPPAPVARRGVSWWSATGALLALCALCIQAAYVYRNELVVLYPETKPWLVQLCAHLDCRFDAPRDAQALTIESHDLQTDPANKSVLALVALLRNRAGFAQDVPHLELTLTDAQDAILARRVFLPREVAATAHMSAHSELPVRILLDPGTSKPSGYRLYAFYP